VLLNITGGVDLALSEISDAADVIAQAADPEASIIFGAVIDPKIENEVRITVIATGFEVSDRPRQSGYRGRVGRPAYGPSIERSQPTQEQAPPAGRDRGLPIEERDRDRPPERDQGPIRVGTIGSSLPEPVFNDQDDDLDIPPFLRGRRR
jgi:cell division protein FtsZ